MDMSAETKHARQLRASKINRRPGVNCGGGYSIRINTRCKLNARGREEEYHLLPWI